MTTQSEQALENELITQLGGLGYVNAEISDEAELLANLKTQLEAFFNRIEQTAKTTCRSS